MGCCAIALLAWVGLFDVLDKHDSCCFGCLIGLLGLSWFCRMGSVGSLGVVVAVGLGYVSVIGLVVLGWCVVVIWLGRVGCLGCIGVA